VGDDEQTLCMLCNLRAAKIIRLEKEHALKGGRYNHSVVKWRPPDTYNINHASPSLNCKQMFRPSRSKSGPRFKYAVYICNSLFFFKKFLVTEDLILTR
jgi:hypothetical protein